ncbi:MAG: Mur ligase family protein, partial [Tepidisphaeraceae bacterium]
MLLHQLLRQFDPQIDLAGIANIEVFGVQEDSRQVRTGDLFVARPGTQTDGVRFVTDAHARGAVAVLTRQRVGGLVLPQVVIADPGAPSALANSFHGHPSAKMKVLGVTGTNGKTTTTWLLRHVLGKCGLRCGLVGTVELDDGRTSHPAAMTTPGPVELAELLASMVEKECEACAMEASSHALHQRRAAGVRFAGAGFTNLSGDHLDYHGNMQDYAASKKMLFDSLAPDAVACVNADDAQSHLMVRDCKARIIRFAMQTTADYRAADIAVTAQGSRFILQTPDGRAEVAMQLIGRHNIENALCAAS